MYVVNHSAGHGSLASRVSRRVVVLPDGDLSQLLSFVEAAQIELINSHVWWSDKLAYDVKRERPEIRWLITMHGCYEQIIQKPQIDSWFFDNVTNLLACADGVAYLADKNLAVFEHFGIPVQAGKVRKVYNGITMPKEVFTVLNRKQLAGRVAHEFILTGRGIAEKGWHEAAEALVKRIGG